MEALMRAILALSGRAFNESDKVWIKATEAFFSVFLVIMVGVPVLAHFGMQGTIFAVMIAFFLVWIVATLRIKHIAVLAGVTLGYGVPAKGDAGDYAKKALSVLFKAVFLVLIWGEIWMAVYFHFPSFAKEWWMIGSAVGIMLVVIPMVIYALGTGEMLEGPWHRPVLAVSIAMLVVVMFSAIPTGAWTSMGINPLSFKIPETTERAQAIRSKSYDNLVGQKLKEMQSLQQKVEKGGVLSADELKKLESLETEAKVTPSLPQHAVVKAVNDLPAVDLTEQQIVIALAVLLLLVWVLRKRKSSAPFWLAILLLAGYFAVNSATVRGFTDTLASKQASSQQEAVPVTRTYFIEDADWGRVGARRISEESGMLSSIEPLFRIEKGQYNGKRPVPILGMNGGNNITLLIEPDPDNEAKDLVIAQNMQCPKEASSDGSWVCESTWYSRGYPQNRGAAYFLVRGGNRTISLHGLSGERVVSFRIE